MAPTQERPNRACVRSAGVPVANGRGEELKEPTGGVVASVGDDRGQHRSAMRRCAAGSCGYQVVRRLGPPRPERPLVALPREGLQRVSITSFMRPCPVSFRGAFPRIAVWVRGAGCRTSETLVKTTGVATESAWGSWGASPGRGSGPSTRSLVCERTGGSVTQTTSERDGMLPSMAKNRSCTHTANMPIGLNPVAADSYRLGALGHSVVPSKNPPFCCNAIATRR